MVSLPHAAEFRATSYRELRGFPAAVVTSRLTGRATRLNKVALEVTDLVERCDTAIKFVSDMFAARLYRLAVGKIRVPGHGLNPECFLSSRSSAIDAGIVSYVSTR